MRKNSKWTLSLKTTCPQYIRSRSFPGTFHASCASVFASVWPTWSSLLRKKSQWTWKRNRKWIGLTCRQQRRAPTGNTRQKVEDWGHWLDGQRKRDNSWRLGKKEESSYGQKSFSSPRVRCFFEIFRGEKIDNKVISSGIDGELKFIEK